MLRANPFRWKKADLFTVDHQEQLRRTYLRVLPLSGILAASFLYAESAVNIWGEWATALITATLFLGWAGLRLWPSRTMTVLRCTLTAVFVGITLRLFGIYTPGEQAGWPEFLNMSESLYALAVLMIVAHTLYSQVWARMVSLTIWTGASLVAMAGLGFQRLHGTAVQGSVLDTVQFVLAGLVSVCLMEVFSQMSALQIRSAVQNSLLQRYALTDTLTELPNRRGFQNACQREFAPERRQSNPMSLIVLDIDHFKQINDVCGHDRGDCVLRQVAQVVRSATRPTHYPVRWGGDEFAVLLPGCGIEEARELADKIRAEIEHYRFNLGPVTASLGTAEYAGDRSVDSLFKRADQALYRAKRLGRNRTEIEDEKDAAKSSESFENLRSAIESRTESVSPHTQDQLADK